MRISTFVGSIVDPRLGAHVIVNASNPEVALGSGVSGAIRVACGGLSYQQEVRAAWEADFGEPLEADDCLRTGAGSCEAFRWVLHVPAVDYRKRDPETGGASGPRRVRACTLAAVAEAEAVARDEGLPGRLVVGMPLRGAGHGGLGEVASADVIMAALAERRSDLIAEVRFAVLTDALARLVQHAVARHAL